MNTTSTYLRSTAKSDIERALDNGGVPAPFEDELGYLCDHLGALMRAGKIEFVWNDEAYTAGRWIRKGAEKP